jgi:hypothetical protein
VKTASHLYCLTRRRIDWPRNMICGILKGTGHPQSRSAVSRMIGTPECPRGAHNEAQRDIVSTQAPLEASVEWMAAEGSWRVGHAEGRKVDERS